MLTEVVIEGVREIVVTIVVSAHYIESYVIPRPRDVLRLS